MLDLVNLLKYHNYWTQPPPLGVRGVPMHRLLDLDEFHFSLTKISTKYGYARTTVRVRLPGHYSKTPGVSVLVGIEPGDPSLGPAVTGSVERPRRWILVVGGRTVTQEDYARLCDEICGNVEDHPIPEVDERRYVTHDNHSMHLTDLVYQTVEMRPYRGCTFEIVRRPPYQPKIAPIEYKIGEVCQIASRRVTSRTQPGELEAIVRDIFDGMSRDDGNFHATFVHCGYTADGVYPAGGYPP